MEMEAQAMKLEVAMKHSQSQVREAFVRNLITTMPAMVPDLYSKAEFLKGAAPANGTVIKISYNRKGFEHYDYVTLVMDAVDEENFKCKLTIVDGGFLDKHFKKIIYHVKILPGSDNTSCVLSCEIEYEDLHQHNFHNVLKEEVTKFCKSLEACIDTIKKA